MSVPTPEALNHLRTEIDRVDQIIIQHLNERVKLAAEIGKIKHAAGAPIYVPGREEEVFQKVSALSAGPLGDRAIRRIYREIISASISLEKVCSIGYLGPTATYTHQAALKNFGSSQEYIPLATIPEIFSSVERGHVDYGVIPIENSTEGAVHHALDLLVETDVRVIAQIYLKIEHCLISQSPLNEIEVVTSKDQALAQCRHWLQEHIPQAQQVDCLSTGDAVQQAKANPRVAAIASSLAAEIHGVPIQVRNIQDRIHNTTRFFVIGGPAQEGALHATGRDKTSIVISLTDTVGSLEAALVPFAQRGINLSKIESRPSRRRAWDYFFFIDFLGHYHDADVQEALADLRRICPFVKWVGSYPLVADV
jgi:chorismate mutase/prephenate dehydratase